MVLGSLLTQLGVDFLSELLPMKKIVPSNRQGMTLIEVLCDAAILGVVLALALPVFEFAIERYGLPIGILFGMVSFVLITVAVLAVLWVVGAFVCPLVELFLPGAPTRCESGKCLLSDCYHVQLFPDGFFSITYYKCSCQNEYILYRGRPLDDTDFGIGFLAKVDIEGNLIPYRYFHAPWGWYKDRRKDSDVYRFAVPLDLLCQLRNESTDESFVSIDNRSNTLVLQTPCNLSKNPLGHNCSEILIK